MLIFSVNLHVLILLLTVAYFVDVHKGMYFSFKKEEKEKPKTYLERLAAERDAKRRKVSKKVHTNRKSHIEVCIKNVCKILGKR